jgi:hypothetical protein
MKRSWLAVALMMVMLALPGAHVFAQFGGIEAPVDLSRALVGEWRIISQTGVLHNSDGSLDEFQDIDLTNWEANMHHKPDRTYFLSDSTYYTEIRSIKDSVILRKTGTWTVKGDSLLMSQIYPPIHSAGAVQISNVSRFRVSLWGDIATFVENPSIRIQGTAGTVVSTAEYTTNWRKYR